MDEPAVAVQGLTKVFPIPFRRTKLVALRGLSLEVAPGQVYGLLGPNGSGKSTALKIILGLVAATAGTSKIFGRDSREVRSREAVGFLPENPYFYKYLTGQETLRFYGKLCGLRGQKLKARTHELLDLVRLQDARNRRLGGYSKGMLQRIGLAQSLIQEPKLVVLDEPTAGVRPRRLARNSRPDSRFETAWHYRSSFFPSPRAGAGNLRSGRHPREWHPR